MTILIGPLIALIGIMAIFLVMRTRSRVRKSMYANLREDRTARLREARERALHPQVSAATATAEEAPAAASAGAAAPAAPAPAPAEPEAEAEPAPPAAAAAPAPPAWDVIQPVEAPPEPDQPAAPPPAPPAPAAPLEPAAPAAASPWPTPQPAAPSWEPVPQPGEREAEPAAAADRSTASWEIVPQQKKPVAAVDRKKIDAQPPESMTQTVLSYVGLAAALIVVLLGILLMIGSSRA